MPAGKGATSKLPAGKGATSKLPAGKGATGKGAPSRFDLTNPAVTPLPGKVPSTGGPSKVPGKGPSTGGPSKVPGKGPSTGGPGKVPGKGPSRGVPDREQLSADLGNQSRNRGRSNVQGAFDWKKLAVSSEPMQVPSELLELNGVAAGSSEEGNTHELSDGTKIEYIDVTTIGEDGGLKLYRVRENAGIDVASAVRSIQRNEAIKTLLDGPAGLQEVSNDLTGTRDGLSYQIKLMRGASRSYKEALAENKIKDSAQVGRIKKAVTIFDTTVPFLQDKLNQMDPLINGTRAALATTVT